MSYGSNLPPGVTGNELEIAGPSSEGEVSRSCTQTHVEIEILGDEAKKILAARKHSTAWGAVTAEDLASMAVTIALDECPFIDMEVDAWVYGGVLNWTCPVCGREYEEDGRDE